MSKTLTPILCCLLFVCGPLGCQQGPNEVAERGLTPQRAVRPPSLYAITDYKLEIALDPKLHRLEATAELEVVAVVAPKAPGERLRLQLHRDLGIDSITMEGKPVAFERVGQPDRPKAEESAAKSTTQPTAGAEKTPASSPAEECPSGEAAPAPPAVYELALTSAGPVRLTLKYGGQLYQDIAAGEKPGEIHNFTMRAHVGEEGVYLAEDGDWYPGLPDEDDDEAEPRREYPLANYEVRVTNAPGLVMVACGNRQEAEIGKPRDATTTWKTPFPIQGMCLVGGFHEIHQRQVDHVLVSVHVSREHAKFAKGLLDAAESYLRLYQPLLGNYPYVEFTIFENFFSSGFGFPGYTALASQVIGMGEMGLKPGYLDHEMLHNWWGNGVFTSSLDGNWCECLTSYCANYMHHVLAGRTAKARQWRRDQCYSLSRIKPDKDKPLDRFGRKDGPGSGIGYYKGAFVFAMLSQRIGEDQLWRALRRFYFDRLGKPATWADIQRTIEKQSGRPLGKFFDSWVHGSGIPDIAIDDASFDPTSRRLNIITVQRGDRPFDIDLPIRIVYGDGSTLDASVPAGNAARATTIRTLDAPKYVLADPDFLILRKIPMDHIMPTISRMGRSKSLTIVQAEADYEPYADLANSFHDDYKDAGETRLTEVKAADVKPDDLKTGHVLFIGEACLTDAARPLLEGQPLAFGDGYFTVGEKRYDKPGHAVLCCINHPDDPDAIVCFYYGNSETAVKKARYATFYGGNSLVVWENGKPGLRRDFEQPQRVEVRTEQ